MCFLGKQDSAPPRASLWHGDGALTLLYLFMCQGVVKRFFNEKEVTSTLVMDALFSGCKQLEEASRQLESKKVKFSS